MDNISAIETRYKGYRFRSRLEARWAMFFDRIGIGWVHEPQPYAVRGEPYLPDFLLTIDGKEVVHEVKSLHERERIGPQKAYLAGKMKAEHEWRGNAAVTGMKRDGASYGVSPQEWWEASRLVQMDGACFYHVGPFSLSDDHGGAHGEWVKHMAEGNDGEIPGRQITHACLQSIARADIFCAHFSTADAYGTLIELGVAVGLGKKVCVTIDLDLAETMTRPSPEYDHNVIGAHDLWFAEAVATRSARVSGFEGAREVHAQFIRENTPKEYRTISGLAEKMPAVLTFGDPLDVANHGGVFSWSWGAGVKQLCIGNRVSAEAIRAHRFA